MADLTAEDPRLTNILKLVFGGLSQRSPDADPSIAAGPMPAGNQPQVQTAPPVSNVNNSAPWGPNNLGLPEDMPRNYGVTDDFGKGSGTYGPVAGGKVLYGPYSVDGGAVPIIRNSIPPTAPNTPATPEHQNILQRLFGGGLTKTGVEDTSGKQKFYNDPSQAGVALAQQMHPAAQVATANLPGDLNSTADASFSTPATPLLPKIFKPTFAQASRDAAGNVTPINPSETKLGKLLHILSGGVQGTLDAMASGALDAVPGRSAFGAGLQGALQMPEVRAQRQEAQTKEQLQNQLTQAQIQNIPAQRQQAQAALAATQAETPLKQAQTKEAAAKAEAAAKPKPENLDQLIATATDKAIQEGRAPAEDPTVQQLSDVKTSLLKQATANKDDTAIAILGKPSSMWTAPEKAYMKGYQSYVKMTKTDPGVMRIEAMAQTRGVPVMDTKNNNTLQYLDWADVTAANKNEPGRYVPAGPGMAALKPTALLEDVRGNIQQTRDALNGLKNEFDLPTRAKIALALRSSDPHSSFSTLLTNIDLNKMPADQQEYIQALASLAENSMSLRSVTGGSSAQDVRSAITSMLPSGATPTRAYGLKQLGLLEKTVDRLERGVPSVKLKGQDPNQSQPAAKTNPHSDIGFVPLQ